MRLLFIGGPMHGKRTEPLDWIPLFYPVDIVDCPPVRPLTLRDGFTFDAYGVLPPKGMFRTVLYEMKIAMIRGRKVSYLRYKEAA